MPLHSRHLPQSDSLSLFSGSLSIAKLHKNVHLVACARDLLGDRGHTDGDFVAKSCVVIAEAKELAPEIRTAHDAIELRRAGLESKDVAQGLALVLVVLDDNLPELPVLNVHEEGALQVLGVVACDPERVLHADLVERNMVWNGVVALLECILEDDELAVGVVSASITIPAERRTPVSERFN